MKESHCCDALALSTEYAPSHPLLQDRRMLAQPTIFTSSPPCHSLSQLTPKHPYTTPTEIPEPVQRTLFVSIITTIQAPPPSKPKSASSRKPVTQDMMVSLINKPLLRTTTSIAERSLSHRIMKPAMVTESAQIGMCTFDPNARV